MPSSEIPAPVALLGGTGRSGPGLAMRFAAAGIEVLIGSREHDKAAATAEAVTRALQEAGRAAAAVGAGTNLEVARRCGLAVMTVPHEGVVRVCDPDVRTALAGKLVVSTVVPTRFDPERGPEYVDIEEGSAAEQIAALLPQSTVSAAFHSVSSAELRHLDHEVDGDVAVCTDDPDALAVTTALAQCIHGVRAVNAGPLRAAAHAEHLTVLLLSINRANRARTGVRFTGLPR